MTSLPPKPSARARRVSRTRRSGSSSALHTPSTGGGRPPKAPTAEKPVYFKTVATNRRARHDYHIEETFEAGIELHGSEVKSLRQGKVSFADSFARVENAQCWLIGLQITQYEKTFVQVPDPVRKRRLLLARREIDKLQLLAQRAGYTLIPLEIYFKGSWAKVKLGLAKGKALYDKRETLKRKMADREIARAMKSKRR